MSVIFRFRGGLWLGGFLAFSAAVWGENLVTPQGAEFSILSLPGDQVWPTVSLSTSGGCVAWQDSRIDKGGGGLGTAILDTSFTAGKVARVNNTTLGNHFRPKVQLLADNNMVIVWESRIAGTPDIYARFAKESAKDSAKNAGAYGTNFYTGDVRVNTYVKGQQMDPAVAALPDGSAIITWSSWGEDGSMFGVYARQFKPTGVGVTPKEFRVNQYTANNQREPTVAALPNGNYVIAWISELERYPYTNTDADVYARVFTDAGVPLTDEIPVNSGTMGTTPCDTPAIAPLGDGGFTVVWSQKDMVIATNGWDIWARAFNASGTPEGTDFLVNTYRYGDQFQPKIAAGPSGSMVVWTSLNQDGSREGVFGRFLAGGTQVSGSEFRVNTTTISQQMHPSVAWDGVGHFLVVWTSFTGLQGFDLFGQLYVLSQ
jgi:hypothetical protein